MKIPFRMLIVIAIFAGLLLALLSSTDWSQSPEWLNVLNQTQTDQTAPNGTNFEQARVSRVVDGDTVELSDGRKIRYLNVDTPETVKPSTPVMCYGNEAKQANKKQVEGTNVWLRWDKEKQDRYGRDLRIVYLTKQDAETQNIQNSVNAYMVKNGFARSISYAPNKTYKKDFDSMMQTAIDTKTGVWGKCSRPFES